MGGKNSHFFFLTGYTAAVQQRNGREKREENGGKGKCEIEAMNLDVQPFEMHRRTHFLVCVVTFNDYSVAGQVF